MNSDETLKLTALFEHLKSHPEELSAHIELAETRGAAFSFAKAASADAQGPVTRPADAPPLWAERKAGWNEGTGEKASPALWIKMHYGQTLPDGSWDSVGLRREHILKIDFPLYSAFSQWVKRHPEDEFDPSAGQKRTKYTDPAEAIDRLREQKRTSNLKNRRLS